MDKKYTVYKHTNKFNNKVYIGITSRKVEVRWGADGCGYISSPRFMSAILKYGGIILNTIYYLKTLQKRKRAKKK